MLSRSGRAAESSCGRSSPQSGRLSHLRAGNFSPNRDKTPMAAASRLAHSCRTGGNAVLKRLSFFAYGFVSYVIFLATFLYAIAFVGGFIVPRRLDGELQTSITTALALDGLLLTVF